MIKNKKIGDGDFYIIEYPDFNYLKRVVDFMAKSKKYILIAYSRKYIFFRIKI